MNGQPIKLTVAQREMLEYYGEYITTYRDLNYHYPRDFAGAKVICRNLHERQLLAAITEHPSWGPATAYRITDIGLKWLADNEKQG